jgi:antitoxin component HigA of HigAB toxin-antitoxin module
MVRHSTSSSSRAWSPSKVSSRAFGADPYLDLILNVHPLRPIRTDQEHREAKKALRSLASDKRKVAAEFTSVLACIIETYERQKGMRLDTSNVFAADVVHHLLAERRLSVNAFAKARGISQSALSDMLNGKRQWSRSAIINIADYFGLNPAIFLK